MGWELRLLYRQTNGGNGHDEFSSVDSWGWGGGVVAVVGEREGQDGMCSG